MNLLQTQTPKDQKYNKLVDRIDRLLGFIAAWAVMHRSLVVLICLVMLAGSLYFAGKVPIDNSLDAYFDKSDPAYIAYQDYLEEFLSDEVTYIIYRVPDRPYGPFDWQTMRQVAQLTRELEDEVPFAREVTSLANVEFIRADGDSISIDELMLDFPETQEELIRLRELVLSRPLYVDYLINPQADYAAIILEMDRSSVDVLEDIIYDPEVGNVLDNLYPQVSYNKVTEILARPDYADIEFFLTGDVPMNAVYNYIFLEDSSIGMVLTLLLLALLSFLLFRATLIGMLGPILVVILSIVMVLGIMGAFGWVLGLFFGIVPTLLCAVGVAQSVHILLEFQRSLNHTGDRRESVRVAITQVGGACLMAALTTAVGFLVMTVSELKALSEMALYAAAGVMFTFILSVTLLVVFLPWGNRAGKKAGQKKTVVHPAVLWLVNHSINLNLRHPKTLITTGIAVMLISAVGVTQLRIDFNFLEEFKPHVEWRQHTELAERVMGGILNVSYIIDTGMPDGVKNPELLQALDSLQQFAETHPLVKKAYSIADIQKDINRSFHGDDPAWYRLPTERDLIAQYFLVYELSGGDELEDFVSLDYARTVLELRVEITQASNIIALLNDIDDYLLAHPLPGAEVRKSGIGLMWVKIAEYISNTQIESYSLMFVMVALFLCLAFGSVKVGLLTMIPNIAPILLVLGVMGWLDIYLDWLKLLLATIAIGIAVDDSIHLVVRFRRCFFETGNYRLALEQSMRDVAPALVITTLILAGAFSCYLFSNMAVIASFGMLLIIVIVAALIADLLLTPALILVARPFGPEFGSPTTTVQPGGPN